MGWGAVAVLIAVTGLSLFYRSCLGVIAPELTRDLGLTPEDLGNANGAFFLAIKAQVPVVPIALIGTYQMLPFGSGAMRPGPVTMRIGAPVATAGLGNKDREALSARVRAEIERLLAG